MKHTVFLGTLLVGACSLLAQNAAQLQQTQPPQPQQQPAYPRGSPEMNRPTDPVAGDSTRDSPPTKIDDKTFLKRIAGEDILQVELGKLAAEKGSSDAVKQYGRKMADDRQKTHEEVVQLASKQGVAVPEALDTQQKVKIDRLSKLDGQNFDKALLKEVLQADGDDVANFRGGIERRE